MWCVLLVERIILYQIKSANQVHGFDLSTGLFVLYCLFVGREAYGIEEDGCLFFSTRSVVYSLSIQVLLVKATKISFYFGVKDVDSTTDLSQIVCSVNFFYSNTQSSIQYFGRII